MFYPPNASTATLLRMGNQATDQLKTNADKLVRTIKACHPRSYCSHGPCGRGNPRLCKKLQKHYPSTLQWAMRFLAGTEALPEAERPLMCITSPGMMMAVPNAWYHATLNLAGNVDSVIACDLRAVLTTCCGRPTTTDTVEMLVTVADTGESGRAEDLPEWKKRTLKWEKAMQQKLKRQRQHGAGPRPADRGLRWSDRSLATERGASH